MTIGDHLRKRRLDLGLLQRDLADRLGVTESTVTNWELNRTEPELRFLPGIFSLLGFDPRPVGATLAEQLVTFRTAQGLSQEGAARILGVDPGTLSRWERGLRTPAGGLTGIANAVIEDGQAPTGQSNRLRGPLRDTFPGSGDWVGRSSASAGRGRRRRCRCPW